MPEFLHLLSNLRNVSHCTYVCKLEGCFMQIGLSFQYEEIFHPRKAAIAALRIQENSLTLNFFSPAFLINEISPPIYL